ncbi:conserved hypothetical protein [Desulforapulum autotrophicum HRM2]|uniref:DUF1848 domain-containing protein n=1 Tax=Desulforapulum autotrophicum (strain ATCC 43914 / DSM 3382 / VKM B-1955 / HRM2) TaxID=177437 RepID=C0QJX5_DESAH|nr:DUF1848 domain-containing protein [Desulforapulum autotrophicum]ACN16001.1 conserved hypothetical protein [Desulforapulum autotrophicum HRM2]
MGIKWPKTTIETPEGPCTAIAPWIISASRATDIPACYSEWFFDKLKKGYVQWINPFNRFKPQYVSFANTCVIVFWTKNPAPMIPLLERLESLGIACYFQFTLNDYEAEGFEPGVPPLNQRMETFQALSERLGKERVIWRFDPLLMTDRSDPDQLISKIHGVGEIIHPFTEKLVFSFADISNYKKVTDNLARQSVRYRDFDTVTMADTARKISEINKPWGLKLATCGEAIDLSAFGIEHNKCIDDELILRITDKPQRSTQFEKFLGYERQGDLFAQPMQSKSKRLKDKGQRRECNCIYSKDIGSYNTCPHGCIYCYANDSAACVAKNRLKIRVENAALVP